MAVQIFCLCRVVWLTGCLLCNKELPCPHESRGWFITYGACQTGWQLLMTILLRYSLATQLKFMTTFFLSREVCIRFNAFEVAFLLFIVSLLDFVWNKKTSSSHRFHQHFTNCSWTTKLWQYSKHCPHKFCIVMKTLVQYVMRWVDLIKIRSLHQSIY